MSEMFAVTPALLGAAKWAFTTRRIRRGDAVRLAGDVTAAVAGDLVLAEVREIGQHKTVQLAEGRLSALHVGDLLVLAAGDRYAPDQFEAVAEVGAEAADLIAAGGLVGRWRERHAKMADPTRLRPLGLVTDAAGEVLNIAARALPERARPVAMTVIGVTGASMNSGKTTATASLARGLTLSGHRTAAIKATGTGAFGDYNAFLDTGAAWVGDFTDVGMPTTYRQPLDRIVRGLDTLLGHAADAGCSVAVVELADGVFQQETRAILADPALAGRFAGFLLAAPDALSAVGGALVLGRYGLKPAAMSGLISLSPLAVREAEAETGIPVLTREQLAAPATASLLLSSLRSGQPLTRACLPLQPAAAA